MEQGTLFAGGAAQPLAARLRPDTLEEFVGQRHLLGEGKVLRRLIESDRISSMIFWGPPGVGKTSIASAIAKAMGRRFVRMSLGGVRDEAEIRGHRRTYIGAQPGRVIAAMQQAGTVNPLLLFDEIDKLAYDVHGDPAAAMLEVLDSAQNNSFTDHFLELPYDLSQCLLMTTANDADRIPGPLRDRMELIEVPSYLFDEKMEIARRHLLPRQMEKNGLKRTNLRVDDRCLMRLIEGYTREASACSSRLHASPNGGGRSNTGRSRPRRRSASAR